MNSISVIIPCYNAEKLIIKNIKKVINKLNKNKNLYEIIIVNDGSTDRTLSEINKLKNSKIRIISYKKNNGKSYAIRKGLKIAKYKNIIFIDCDLPYFEKFDMVIRKLETGFDFVSIDRKHKKSNLKNNKLNMYQFFRHIVGNIISKIIHLLLPLKLNTYDTQAGLKGIKVFKNFKKLNFFSNKFFLDLELICYFLKKKKFFYFIPVKYEINYNSSIKFFSFNSIKILYELFFVIIFLRFNLNKN